MKTVILCGGYGTRIRDVAENIPKPMSPVGGYPILWHIMKYYAVFGYTEFVLCLGYKSEAIKDFFFNYETHASDFTLKLGVKNSLVRHNSHSEEGWTITMAETGLNAMTGARVKRIEKYIGDDDCFMLTYGDGVGDVDIARLVEFHRSHGKIATLTGVYPPGRFGELVTTDAREVIGFNEKPQVSGGRINGGFFVFDRAFFSYLNDDENLVLEQEPIQHLVADGQLMVFEHDGFWQPMDTSREYNLLNQLYATKQAPWVKW
ncbi:MAG: glucose-1-phosphate cytidylyltransferase [Prevotellaceae bacterium]|jgi:glucose-1-phosphate cytidylyltransferase|nr:glucose-1-phosphate cytidylyltransferase [Prevotellaceae bacterium]